MNMTYKHGLSGFSAMVVLGALSGCGGSGFSAAPARVLLPVNLNSAANYTILADTGVSNAALDAERVEPLPTDITGNIGVGPGVTSTAITGFALTLPPQGAFSTSSQVKGKVYAFDYASPTPADVTKASKEMLVAYNDAANRALPDFLNMGDGNLGGLTLAPGLYKWTKDVTLPFGTDVTLSGGANDVWIFQIDGKLTTGAATKMILSGGAMAKNIFWQVAGSSVTLGAKAHLEGVVLAKFAINFGEKATANGRLLSQTAVGLDQNTVADPPLF